MAPSIGLNLRVTGYCNQGGRKYMEDVFSVAYQQTEDEKDLEYAFFGIFDGHGGREAAVFAKEHLMDFVVKQKMFWADDDESVLRAIREGFIQTHQAMWGELEKWPKTVSGLPSTAGTTASIAFIRRGKIYIGHVGDSAIVLGFEDPSDDSDENVWRSVPLTIDHKPESDEESRRIEKSGGKVICKSGVPRVVWNRPKMGHKGPVRRSTHIDEIPFLAVARSLGDLWSYNSEEDVFVVSPEPDTYVYPIDIAKNRCLILGTDGAWNMLTPAQAVAHVCQAERSNEQHMLYPHTNVANGSSVASSSRQWINPSKYLVDRAIERWNGNNLRADNTSIVTVMLDPPGPPRAQVLKRQRELATLNDVNGVNRVPIIHGDQIQPSSCISETKTASENAFVDKDAFGFNGRGSVALVTNTVTPSPPHNEKFETSNEVENLKFVSEGPHHKESLVKTANNLHSKTTSEQISSNENVGRPPKSVSIISRFPNSKNIEDVQGHGLIPSSSRILHDFQTSGQSKASVRRPLPMLPPLPQASNCYRDHQSAIEQSSHSRTGTSSASNILSAQSRAALNRLADTAYASAALTSSAASADSGSSNFRRGQRSLLHKNAPSNAVLQSSKMHNINAKTTQEPSLSGHILNTIDNDKDIQCSEISSSDDENCSIRNSLSNPNVTSNVSGVSSSGTKNRLKVLKETRLSRELNALQLDSPHIVINKRTHSLTRKRRFEIGEHNSDTENEEHIINRPIERRKLRSSSISAETFSPSCDEKAVLEQCKKLNNRIRNMERKVAKKTEELNQQVRQLQSTLIVASRCSNSLTSKSTKNKHFLRSSQAMGLKPSTLGRNKRPSGTSKCRSLRSNTSTSVIPKNKSPCSNRTTPMSAHRKRKMCFEQSPGTTKIQPAKSPRNISSSVVRASAINKRAIIYTRSKRARILHLKK